MRPQPRVQLPVEGEKHHGSGVISTLAARSSRQLLEVRSGVPERAATRTLKILSELPERTVTRIHDDIHTKTRLCHPTLPCLVVLDSAKLDFSSSDPRLSCRSSSRYRRRTRPRHCFWTRGDVFLTLSKPLSRYGDKLLGIRMNLSLKRDCGCKTNYSELELICPQNGSAVIRKIAWN